MQNQHLSTMRCKQNKKEHKKKLRLKYRSGINSFYLHHTTKYLCRDSYCNSKTNNNFQGKCYIISIHCDSGQRLQTLSGA